MTWLQTCAKSKCATGSSDKGEGDNGDKDKVKKKDNDMSNKLLPPMAQTIPSMSDKKKNVIKLVEEEDNSSKSDNSTDMSAFKTLPSNKAKKVVEKPKKAEKIKK
eukprot:4127541-Ditylum_brightwellii.AAC.1